MNGGAQERRDLLTMASTHSGTPCLDERVAPRSPATDVGTLEDMASAAPR
jgi:hypothetical protein